MSIEQTNNTSQDAPVVVNFGVLYDNHPKYIARRVDGSYEQEQIALEVTGFKVPNLTRLLPRGWTPRRVLEIGCATGELIAAFPVAPDGHRVGVDISASNISSACVRFPSVEFHAGNFTNLSLQKFDCVILSDILEHVKDDVHMLAAAACLGQYVLVNLPLEDNWINRSRAYGVDDTSGHLRKYSLEQGLDLFKYADLQVLGYNRIWMHETAVACETRQLRRHYFGVEYNGRFGIRVLKRMVMQLVCVLPSLGRSLFSSNLFAIAQKSENI
ncbi:MAG: class I SAM-dependent methyltransferase [Proteobacteria bacterium]|nr:class I SAM-dependent methyltransferase [Pseudomonadota bacterium]